MINGFCEIMAFLAVIGFVGAIIDGIISGFKS